MAKIRTYSDLDGHNLVPTLRWDTAFYSDQLDSRGRAAVAWAKARATATTEIKFDGKASQLSFTDRIAWSTDLRSKLNGKGPLLLEATTLGVAEILLLLKAARQAGVSDVDFLYVEPVDYQRTTSEPLIWGREFSLSGSRSYVGLKGFAIDLSIHEQGQLVAFLGYEGARLKQALEQLPVEGWMLHAVFGVPGFEPGWDINAFANNVGSLTDQDNCSIQFCAAASVSSAYRLLTKIHRDAEWQESPTVVLPIGTKPHSIAGCIFLCEHTDFQASGLSFDHPNRSKDRTDDIRKWHLFRVRFGTN